VKPDLVVEYRIFTDSHKSIIDRSDELREESREIENSFRALEILSPIVGQFWEEYGKSEGLERM
jgi:hypothetical protein